MSFKINNYTGWKEDMYSKKADRYGFECIWYFRQDVDTEKWDYIIDSCDGSGIDDKSQREFNSYEECLAYARSTENRKLDKDGVGGDVYGENEDPAKIVDRRSDGPCWDGYGGFRGKRNRYHDANHLDWSGFSWNEGVTVAEIKTPDVRGQ